ncbi:MAG: PDZ domain-containing protein [Verrucomicrobia bacterium]|nr:PDZ domain-containing protein [Verrucomicrobiota bacterium]
MRNQLAILLVSSALTATVSADWVGGTAATVERAVARVKPALVRIEVVSTRFQSGRALKQEAGGSGVIVRKDGYILSNHHVAGHATRLVCILSDNEEIEAELVGTDPLSDLAVLRLKPEKPRVFPAATFGDSDKLKVGDTVLAMGSPLALAQSVTRGIVSNTKLIMSRPLESGGRFTLDGEDVGGLVRWIAHDAAIFPGNSGGPLVNLRGEIVGINEISFGLGGAIPGNLAQRVCEEIIQHGRVRRAWIGIVLQPLLKSGAESNGALVSGVIADSPAARAGFQVGDLLLALSGQAVNVRHAEEIPPLTQRIASLPIGREIPAMVRRDGQTKTLRVAATERPVMEPKTHELKPWGVTVRDISFIVAKEMRLTNTNGVLVTSVRSGGPSGEAKPPLQAGDVLRAVAGQPVRNVAELSAVTGRLTAGKNAPAPALVAFDRQRDNALTVVNIGFKELEQPGVEARKASLTASFQAISREVAQQLGHKGVTGVRVTQVYPDSAAAKAGLRVGDLIVSLDGEKIPVSQPGDEEIFVQMIRQYRIGTKAAFGILRGKQKLSLDIELMAAPKPEREMRRYYDPNFEFTARDLTYHDRLSLRKTEGQPGVVVTEVASGGWAAVGGLRGGDVIVAVGGESVADVSALEQALKRLAHDRPKQVVFRIQHGIHSRFLELEPAWNQNDSAAVKGKP